MASDRRGSLIGNGGCAAYLFRKILATKPAMNTQQPRSIQCKTNPSLCSTGMMLKDISTQCMSQAQAQSGSIKENERFTSIRSKPRKGMKKWPKMITRPTYHQVPFSRTTYQKVSSGMLPFQMMKYCANVT